MSTALPMTTPCSSVCAHQGRMKGSQPKKVAQDALKLITIRRRYAGARLCAGLR